MIQKQTFFLTIIALFLLLSCAKNKENAGQEIQARKAFLEKVKTVKVTLSKQVQELTLAGKVEYDPDKVASIVPLISGVIDHTYFALGDKVQKGQNMLDLHSTELNSLQSDRISQESELKIAQHELETVQSIYNDGMLSEKELLEAQGKLRQAQAALDKTRSDLSIYGQNKGNASFFVKAPMMGYVVAKNASPGSTVTEGSDPLFTVADLSSVWIVANVYAGDLQFVHEGMHVEITSLSYPDEVFEGRINAISQVFDPEEKVLKARIVMQNKELKFKPEMSVVVKLKDESKTQCIAIPSEALIFDDNRYWVITHTVEGEFESREVRLQGHDGKTTYVASGLNEGELVVIKNQLLIYSGLKGA